MWKITDSSINQPNDRPVSPVEPQAYFTAEAAAADDDGNSENEASQPTIYTDAQSNNSEVI